MGVNKKRFSRKNTSGTSDVLMEGKWKWVVIGVIGVLVLLVGVLTCALLMISVQQGVGQGQGLGPALRQGLRQGLAQVLAPGNFMLTTTTPEEVTDGILSSLSSSSSSSTSSFSNLTMAAIDITAPTTPTSTTTPATTTTTITTTTSANENGKKEVIDMIDINADVDALLMQPLSVQPLHPLTSTTQTKTLVDDRDEKDGLTEIEISNPDHDLQETMVDAETHTQAPNSNQTIEKNAWTPTTTPTAPTTSTMTTMTTAILVEEQEIAAIKTAASHIDAQSSQIDAQLSQSFQSNGHAPEVGSSTGAVTSLVTKEGSVSDGVEGVLPVIDPASTRTPTQPLLQAAGEMERNTTTSSISLVPSPATANASATTFPEVFQGKRSHHRYPTTPAPLVFHATLELSAFLRMGEIVIDSRKQQQQQQQHHHHQQQHQQPQSLQQEEEILQYLKAFYSGIVA